jgi:ATP-dependent Clp protease, protease subunit
MDSSDHGDQVEIAMVGDLTDSENELSSRLLDVPPGGECTLFIDSPGGSPYSGLALMTLMLLRGLRATGIVTGECSSAALWPFAACRRRIVTPYSVLLFHPMKWQSEEHVGLAEAAEWARHFGQLETEMDQVLASLFNVSDEEMAGWIRPGRYISGRELAAAGLAELADLKVLKLFERNGASKVRKRAKTVR